MLPSIVFSTGTRPSLGLPRLYGVEDVLKVGLRNRLSRVPPALDDGGLAVGAGHPLIGDSSWVLLRLDA